MKYVFSFLVGFICATLIFTLFKSSIEKFSNITLIKEINKPKLIEDNCILKQKGKVVGLLYKGLIVNHTSNDELKRFSIEFALDKYNKLHLIEAEELPFTEIIPSDNN